MQLYASAKKKKSPTILLSLQVKKSATNKHINDIYIKIHIYSLYTYVILIIIILITKVLWWCRWCDEWLRAIVSIKCKSSLVQISNACLAAVTLYKYDVLMYAPTKTTLKILLLLSLWIIEWQKPSAYPIQLFSIWHILTIWRWQWQILSNL